MSAQRRTPVLKFTIKMQKKLLVLFLFILAAFVGLSVRLFLINRDNGEGTRNRYCRIRSMTPR